MFELGALWADKNPAGVSPGLTTLTEAAEAALYAYTAGSTAYEEEHFRQGFAKGAAWALQQSKERGEADQRSDSAQMLLAELKHREARLVEALEKVLFALQCMIIQHNGKVPGLTEQQVFDGAIEARDAAREALAAHKEASDG